MLELPGAEFQTHDEDLTVDNLGASRSGRLKCFESSEPLTLIEGFNQRLLEEFAKAPFNHPI